MMWGSIALMTACVMLFHQSDNPTVLNRYSTLVAGLLTGLIGLGVAALVIGQRGWQPRFSRKARPAWASALLVVMACGLLIGLISSFLGDHIYTYAVLRAFLAFSIMLLVLALFPSTSSLSWRLPVILALLVVGILAVLFITVMPPLLKADEAFTLSMGVNWNRTGLTAPLLFQSITVERYAWAGLWLQGLGAWLRLLGEGLAQGRWYFLLIGLAGAGLTGLAAGRLYGRAAGWCATLLMAFMLLRVNFIRPDMFVCLYLGAGLFCYAQAQMDGHWWWHGFAGFFIGLSIDAAPIAYTLGLSAGLMYAARAVRALRLAGPRAGLPLLALGLGGLTAVLVYLWTRQGSSWFVGAESSPDAKYLIELVGRAFRPQADLSTLLLVFAPVLLLALPGVRMLFTSGIRERGVLWMAVLWAALMLFAAQYFPPFYALHSLPLLAILAGVGIGRGLPWLLGRPTTSPALTVLLLTVWLTTWNLTTTLRADSLSDLVETGRQIAAILPAGATVLGAEPYYFGMIEGFGQTFRTGGIERASQAMIGREPAATWAIIQPDAVIFSELWPQEPPRTPALTAYMELNGFQLLACWQTVSFGRVEVWGGAGMTPQPNPEACRPVPNLVLPFLPTS